MTGHITSILADKGFFFLRGDRDVEYFAHKEDLPRGVRIEHLNEGEEWEFEAISDAPRGPRAANLRRPERTLDSLIEKSCTNSSPISSKR